MAATGRKRARLTEGPIWQHLLRLTVASMIGLLAVIGFEVADTWFVSQLGTTELAALSFCMPIISLFLFICIGLGVGTSSVVSRTAGTSSHGALRHLATDALLLGFVLMTVLSIIGQLTIEPLFALLGATDQHMPHIRDFMSIWYLGAPLLGLMLTGNNAVRGTGDSATPATVMVVAGLVNVCLDPLLIFGLWGFPELGLKGAAIATLFARLTAVALTLTILAKREKLIRTSLPSLARLRHSWSRLLHIAAPAALGFATLPIAMAALTKMVATYGEAAVAGFGVATRMEGLIVVAIISLSSSTVPLVGQNWGAGRMDRVSQVLKLTYTGALIWGLLAAIVMSFAAAPLAASFDDNPATVANAALFLTIVPMGYAFLGLMMISAQAANAMARPGASLAMRVGRELCLTIPCAWIGSQLAGLAGLYGGIALALCISGLASLAWVHMQGWLYGRHRDEDASQAASPTPIQVAAE